MDFPSPVSSVPFGAADRSPANAAGRWRSAVAAPRRREREHSHSQQPPGARKEVATAGVPGLYRDQLV